jgi:catechol 2,3-dioxygenase-like lactoylglutathione lyase family enzyme
MGILFWLSVFSTLSFAQSQSMGVKMTDSFRFSKVGYLMMGVADMQKATAFYRDKLGLKETRQTDDLLFFDAGNITLALSTQAGKAPGTTEIVFSVESVHAGYEALKARGVIFDGEPRLITESSWVANFRDPDGHILSLFGSQ